MTGMEGWVNEEMNGERKRRRGGGREIQRDI